MGNGIIAGNKNEITRENLAMLRRFVYGNTVCVNASSGKDFSITNDTNRVTLSGGMVYIYGYAGYTALNNKKTLGVVVIGRETVFRFVKANTVQNWFIYAEIDLSKQVNTFSIKSVNNGRSEDRTFRQDFLSTEFYGVYQLPLYVVKVTKDGIDEITDLRGIGVGETNKINKVKYCDNAENLAERGTIASGVTAVTQSISDDSTKVATTAFVHALIDAQ